jgi:hypothetical protein
MAVNFPGEPDRVVATITAVGMRQVDGGRVGLFLAGAAGEWLTDPV